jgi:hypothetical protein
MQIATNGLQIFQGSIQSLHGDPRRFEWWSGASFSLLCGFISNFPNSRGSMRIRIQIHNSACSPCQNPGVLESQNGAVDADTGSVWRLKMEPWSAVDQWSQIRITLTRSRSGSAFKWQAGSGPALKLKARSGSAALVPNLSVFFLHGSESPFFWGQFQRHR